MAKTKEELYAEFDEYIKENGDLGAEKLNEILKDSFETIENLIDEKMELITQNPDYDLSGGDKNFDSVQIESTTAMIQMMHSDATGTIAAKLQQSTSEEVWDDVPGSAVEIDNSDPSQSWNVTGTVPGSFMRVVVTPEAAATGTVTKINFLT